MESISYTDPTCIIVVEIDSDTATVLIGVGVDAVSEVLNISEEEIEETPAFDTKLNTDYILGMAKTEGRVRILLNIDKVLSAEEITEIEETI
jgi:purine-binding chemotaxis protein CheW